MDSQEMLKALLEADRISDEIGTEITEALAELERGNQHKLLEHHIDDALRKTEELESLLLRIDEPKENQ